MIKLFALIASAALSTSSYQQDLPLFDPTAGDIACKKLHELHQAIIDPAIKPADPVLEAIKKELSSSLEEKTQYCQDRQEIIEQHSHSSARRDSVQLIKSSLQLIENDSFIIRNYIALKNKPNAFILLNDSVNRKMLSHGESNEQFEWPQSVYDIIEEVVEEQLYQSPYNKKFGAELCKKTQQIKYTLDGLTALLPDAHPDHKKIILAILDSVANNLNFCAIRKKILTDQKENPDIDFNMLLVYYDATIASHFHMNAENMEIFKNTLEHIINFKKTIKHIVESSFSLPLITTTIPDHKSKTKKRYNNEL